MNSPVMKGRPANDIVRVTFIRIWDHNLRMQDVEDGAKLELGLLMVREIIQETTEHRRYTAKLAVMRGG